MTALPLLDYALAQSLKSSGMKQVAEHSPRFVQKAYEALVKVARRKIDVHVDDLISELNERAPHPNIFGPIWQKAIRNGIIQRTNQVRASADPRKRQRTSPIYFSRIYGEQP